MPRDYKKKPAPPPAKKQAPGWLYLTVGLLVGAFAVGLFWLGTRDSDRPVVTAKAEKPTAPAAKKTPPPPPKKPERPEVRYEFYTLLPEYEVPVPDQAVAAPRTTAPAQKLEPGSYLLQVGSFKEAREAEAHRAQLALLGLTSSVQTVTINGKETWHRVRVGPYPEGEKLGEVRSLLRENRIEYMVLKEKSG